MTDEPGLIPSGSDQDTNHKGAADEIYRLEAEIARKRQRVAASLGELRRRVTGATNWRHWVGDHPLVWIAAGLSLGFIFGLRRARRD